MSTTSSSSSTSDRPNSSYSSTGEKSSVSDEETTLNTGGKSYVSVEDSSFKSNEGPIIEDVQAISSEGSVMENVKSVSSEGPIIEDVQPITPNGTVVEDTERAHYSGQQNMVVDYSKTAGRLASASPAAVLDKVSIVKDHHSRSKRLLPVMHKQSSDGREIETIDLTDEEVSSAVRTPKGSAASALLSAVRTPKGTASALLRSSDGREIETIDLTDEEVSSTPNGTVVDDTEKPHYSGSKKRSLDADEELPCTSKQARFSEGEPTTSSQVVFSPSPQTESESDYEVIDLDNDEHSPSNSEMAFVTVPPHSSDSIKGVFEVKKGDSRRIIILKAPPKVQAVLPPASILKNPPVFQPVVPSNVTKIPRVTIVGGTSPAVKTVFIKRQEKPLENAGNCNIETIDLTEEDENLGILEKRTESITDALWLSKVLTDVQPSSFGSSKATFIKQIPASFSAWKKSVVESQMMKAGPSGLSKTTLITRKPPSYACGEQFCKYVHRVCTQNRMDGYDYCSRHILEDKAAPFRQCSYISQYNKRRCPNATPKNDKRESFCPYHVQRAKGNSRSRSLKKKSTSGPVLLMTSLENHCENDHDQVSDQNFTKQGLISASEPIPTYLENFAAVYDIKKSVPVIKTHIEDPDDEAVSDNTDEGDALRHAGVYSVEEVIQITKWKYQKLDSLYSGQLKRLQEIYHEKLNECLKDAAEEMSSSDETQASEVVALNLQDASDDRMFKALQNYHRKSGTERILFNKSRAMFIKGVKNLLSPEGVQCAYTEGLNQCDNIALMCVDYCQKHILSDPHQSIYIPCCVEEERFCDNPIIPFERDTTCIYHQTIEEQSDTDTSEEMPGGFESASYESDDHPQHEESDDQFTESDDQYAESDDQSGEPDDYPQPVESDDQYAELDEQSLKSDVQSMEPTAHPHLMESDEQSMESDDQSVESDAHSRSVEIGDHSQSVESRDQFQSVEPGSGFQSAESNDNFQSVDDIPSLDLIPPGTCFGLDQLGGPGGSEDSVFN